MFEFKNDSWITEFIPDNYRGQRLNFDIVDADQPSIVVQNEYIIRYRSEINDLTQ